MFLVVQKATPATRKSTRGRGRPVEFDRDAVIDAAMQTFWTNGVERTTVADLEAATGTVRTTLYNSFDGKAGLHRAAAERYVDIVADAMFEPLINGTDGVADIDRFLTGLADAFRTVGHPGGCFIVNDLTAAERDVEASDRFLGALELGVRRALERAVAAGEISPQRLDPLVGTITTAVVGANLVHRLRGLDAGVAALDSISNVVRTA